MFQNDSNTSKKLAEFEKIFVEEGIREINYCRDVAAGRAQAKSDFSDKIFKTVGILAHLGTDQLPLLTDIFDTALDSLNDARKSGKYETGSQLTDELKQDTIKNILKITARKAARRLEFIMAAKLADDKPHESTVPLATTGVVRSLEFIIRNKLPLTSDNLLQGLIEGRSGAFIDGTTNTHIEGKPGSKDKLTAEGIYGRCGFRTPDGRFFILEEEHALHKQPLEHASILQKIKHASENFLHYGYAKLNKKGDPKYGYAVTSEVIVKQYGYHEHQPSPEMIALIEKYPLENVVITRKDIDDYLLQLRNNNNNNKCTDLNSFIATKYKGTKSAIFSGDLTGVDLSGADLSGCDFSDTNFTKCNLTRTNFNGTILTHANFTGVNATGTQFQEAHLEYATMVNANLTKADLTQAHLNYVDLTSANLVGTNQRGAIWVGANLKSIQKIVGGDIGGIQELSQLQENQHQELKAQLQKQAEDIKRIDQTVAKQTADLFALSARLDNKLLSMDKKQQTEAIRLEELIDKFAQDQQSRAVQERQWQRELNDLRLQNKQSNSQDITRKIEALEHQVKATQERSQELAIVISKVVGSVEMLEKNQLKKSIIGDLEDHIDEIKKTQNERYDALEKQFIKLKEELEEKIKTLEVRQQRTEEEMKKMQEELKKQKPGMPTLTSPSPVPSAIVRNTTAKQDIRVWNDVHPTLENNFTLGGSAVVEDSNAGGSVFVLNSYSSSNSTNFSPFFSPATFKSSVTQSPLSTPTARKEATSKLQQQFPYPVKIESSESTPKKLNISLPTLSGDKTVELNKLQNLLNSIVGNQMIKSAEIISGTILQIKVNETSHREELLELFERAGLHQPTTTIVLGYAKTP